MEELLSLFNQFTELVVKAFGSDPRFMTSRDKSYKLVINDTSVFRLDLPSSRARLEGEGKAWVGLIVHNCTNIHWHVYAYRPGIKSSVCMCVCACMRAGTETLYIVSLSPDSRRGGSAMKTHPESKCPELLANYCDMLLRKTPLSKKLTSEETEGKLRDVVSGEREGGGGGRREGKVHCAMLQVLAEPAYSLWGTMKAIRIAPTCTCTMYQCVFPLHQLVVLKYVQNKDVFMRYHKTHLTRRLILETSADSEKEENMVEWLRVSGGGVGVGGGVGGGGGGEMGKGRGERGEGGRERGRGKREGREGGK